MLVGGIRLCYERGMDVVLLKEMLYRGYYGSVSGDDRIGYWGRVKYTCEELPYSGESVSSLYRSFCECVDRHIDIQQRLADCGLDMD